MTRALFSPTDWWAIAPSFEPIPGSHLTPTCTITRTPHTVYIIRSHARTYVGYTTHPVRRLAQHNGHIPGGAATTSGGGPWTFLAIAHGFASKEDALQFEAALQHPKRSHWLQAAMNKASISWNRVKQLGPAGKLSSMLACLELFRAHRGTRVSMHTFDTRWVPSELGTVRITRGCLAYTNSTSAPDHDRTPIHETRPPLVTFLASFNSSPELAALHTGPMHTADELSERLKQLLTNGQTRFSDLSSIPSNRQRGHPASPMPRKKTPRSLQVIRTKLSRLSRTRHQLGLTRSTLKHGSHPEAQKLARAFRNALREKRKIMRKEIKKKIRTTRGWQLRLFFKNRHELHKRLAGAAKKQCAISPDKLVSHHRDEARSRGCPSRANQQIPWDEITRDVPPFAHHRRSDSNIIARVSTVEVEREITEAAKRKAPGDDGITMDFLKALVKQARTDSPGGIPSIVKVIHRICSLCWDTGTSVKSWKVAPATLIPKPGKPEDEPRSWRHIVLNAVLYKIYAGILARRLTAYILVEGRLSPHQHGFIPGLGTQFHVFSLIQMILHSRATKSDFMAIFIDFTNAFGSCEFEVVDKGLRCLAVPQKFRSIVSEMYDGLKMYLQDIGDKDCTDKYIDLERGVRQGCPLSPIIFITAIDPLLKWLAMGTGQQPPWSRRPTPLLAYADDVVILPKSREEAMIMLSRLEAFSDYSGITINHKKCGVMAGRDGLPDPHCLLTVKGSPLPCLDDFGDGSYYRYLGYEISYTLNWAKATERAFAEFASRLEKIGQSCLPPIAKITCAREWAVPVLTYIMPNIEVQSKWLRLCDTTLRSTVRRWLGRGRKQSLQNGIPNVQLWERISRGGFGVPKAEEAFNSRRFHFLSILLGGTAQKKFNAAATLQFRHTQELAISSLLRCSPKLGAGLHARPSCPAPWAWLDAFLLRHRLQIRKNHCSPGFTLEFHTVHASRLFAPYCSDLEPVHRRHAELNDFNAFIRTMPSNTTCVFTDGSCITDGSGVKCDGAGVVIVWPDGDVWRQSTPIGTSGTNSRAELRAIDDALGMILEAPESESHHKAINLEKDPVLILSDSEYALGCCASVSHLTTHHSTIFSIREKLSKIKGATLRHVPAHTDDPNPAIANGASQTIPLTGNILADELANRGALGTSSFEIIPLETVRTDPSLCGLLNHRPRRPPSQDLSSLPCFSKPLIPSVSKSLCRMFQDDANSRAWLKCADRSDYILDPLAAKISSTPLREAATPLIKARRLVAAKFGLCPHVQANASLFAARGGSRQCPFGCQCVETQRHLLGGCANQFHGFYTTRHDRAVKILSTFLKAHFQDGDVTSNIASCREGLPTALEAVLHGTPHAAREPDITVMHGGHTYLIEVGVTSTPGPRGLTAKEEEKDKQYRDVARYINSHMAPQLTCSCHGIAIGALGTISRSTFSFLSHLTSHLELQDKAIKTLCRRMCNSVLRDADKLFGMRAALRRKPAA